MRHLILAAIACVCCVSMATAQPPSGQAQGIAPLTPQRHYNGIVAGEEAYLANDARREAELGRQVNLNADMYWRWSGASSWYPGVFEAWPVVPGEVFGWPAANAPPRVSPTNVAGAVPVPWAAAQPIARPRTTPAMIAPRSRVVDVPANQRAAADVHPSGGLLPGFAPAAEPAAGDAAGQAPASGGPRSF